MFGEVLHKELSIENFNCQVKTLAPGIIDTEMQAEIRETAIEHFSEKKRFVAYKKNNELKSAPEVAAKKLSVILTSFLKTTMPFKASETISK